MYAGKLLNHVAVGLAGIIAGCWDVLTVRLALRSLAVFGSAADNNESNHSFIAGDSLDRALLL